LVGFAKIGTSSGLGTGERGSLVIGASVSFRLGKLNATLEGALMHSFSLNVKNRKFKSVEKYRLQL
jgi:hypothetical protein